MKIPCKKCDGTGKIKFRLPGDTPDTIRQIDGECPACRGKGFTEITNLHSAKLYSNTGELISQWNNIVKATAHDSRLLFFTLDNGKTITVYGGIVVVEED